MQIILALICVLFSLLKKKKKPPPALPPKHNKPPAYSGSLRKHFLKYYPTSLTQWCCPHFERTELFWKQVTELSAFSTNFPPVL